MLNYKRQGVMPRFPPSGGIYLASFNIQAQRTICYCLCNMHIVCSFHLTACKNVYVGY